MAYRDLPPTNCRRCQQAEMSPVERLIEKLRLIAVGEPLREVMARAATNVIAMATGKGWYDWHRAEFEKTGSMVELDRMLRHQTTTTFEIAEVL